MSDTTKLPGTLIEAVREQRAILFLGAGASMEARSSGGMQAPNGKKLASLLIERFFPDKLKGVDDLINVAEMAISRHSASIVYEYLKELLAPFLPAEAHRSIPLYRWRAIATTNYDLLVEKAYEQENNRLQDLARFVKD